MKKKLIGKQIELIRSMNIGECIFIDTPAKNITSYASMFNFDVTTEECLIITNKIKEPQISRIIKVTKISNGWSCDECVNLITTFTDESFCNLGFKNAKKNYCGGKDFKQK